MKASDGRNFIVKHGDSFRGSIFFVVRGNNASEIKAWIEGRRFLDCEVMGNSGLVIHTGEREQRGSIAANLAFPNAIRVTSPSGQTSRMQCSG